MSAPEPPTDLDTWPCPPMAAGLAYESLARGADFYVQQVVVTLPAPVPILELRRSWAEVIARHQALQTEFVFTAQGPVLRARPHAAMEVSEHDWSDQDPAAAERSWGELLADDRARGIALETAPLMRASVCHLSPSDHRLLWTYHHALLDGRSRLRVLQEVLAPQSSLGPSQVRRYGEWAGTNTLTDEARTFWRGLLAGVAAATPPPPSLPSHDEPNAAPGRTRHQLSRECSDRLRELAAACELSLGSLLQGAFSVLLAQEAADEDLLYATTRAGRRSPPFDVLNTVGLMMVTVPTRLRVDLNRPFTELMGDISRLSRQMRPYEHSPLIEVMRESEIPAGQPAAEVMFSFENLTTEQALRHSDPRWAMHSVDVIERPGYGLMVKAYGDPGIVLTSVWDGRRCRPAAGDRFTTRLVALLTQLADTGLEACVGQLAVMPDDLRRRFARESEAASVPWSDRVAVPQRIAAVATASPRQVAVSHHGTQMTYGELIRRAGEVAAALSGLGVTAGDRVGVATQRTTDMVATILGIHHLGAAYVPIDPRAPVDRVDFISRDSAIGVLVTDAASAPRTGHARPMTLSLEQTQPGVAPPPLHPARSDDLSHVIYTSGSTGRPKGVMIEHSALVALTTWAASRFDTDDRDGVLASTSLSFDLSVFELLVTLALGGRVVLVDDLSEVTRAHFSDRVVHVNTVPSVAANLLRHGALPPSVRVITFCGEVLEPELVQRVAAGSGVQQIWNLYGPSEDTTFSTEARCEPHSNGAVPIGVPLPNTQAYVLNRALAPVPVGVRGELFLGGAGLARGYVGDPQLTAQRFLRNPFPGAPSPRIYRTGDIASWRADGSLDFHGRTDDQVKLRGARIELGEIRAALLHHAEVSDVAVVLGEITGRPALIAYVVAAAGSDIKASVLRERLGDQLPTHAIPASVIVLDTLPVTLSGKLDRRALPPPVQNHPTGSVASPTALGLAAVWQEILGLERPPGWDDEFFALGGDSLDAISMLVLVEERLSVRVDPAVLLRNPSLRALTDVVDAGQSGASVPIVPLSFGGSKPPWFYIVPRYESVFALREDLRRGMNGRPSFTIGVAPDGVERAKLSVETLATTALQALVTQRPGGPYLLGGYSLCGAVAWEVGCRLASQGQDVTVVLIDTRAPHWHGWPAGWTTRIEIARAQPTGPRRLSRYTAAVRFVVFQAWLHARRRWQPSAPTTVNLLLGAYVPPAFGGRVVVLNSRAHAEAMGSDSLGWERYVTGTLETRRIVGEHLTALSSTHAGALVQVLSDALDASPAPSGR